MVDTDAVEAQTCTPSATDEYDDYFNIQTQADVETLNSCQVLNGSVWLDIQSNSTQISFNLPAVQSINGAINSAQDVVPSDILTSVSMESLTQISGDISLWSFSNLTSIHLPVLTSIGGDLDLEILPSLTTLNLSSLAMVGTDITLKTLPSLSSVDLSSLKTMSSLSLIDLPGLDTLSLSPERKNLTVAYPNNQLFSIQGTALSTIEYLDFYHLRGLQITDNPNLVNIAVDVPAVNCATNNGECEYVLNITGNGNTSLSLPTLETLGSDDYGYNYLQGLSSISIPRLQNVAGDLTILSSPYLAQFFAPSLLTAGYLYLENNARLTNVFLPVLQTMEWLLTSHIPAQSTANGISLPKLTSAGNFYIGAEGESPVCYVWRNYACRGIITYLSCPNDIDVSTSDSAKTCEDRYPIGGGWSLDRKLAYGLGICLGIGLGIPLVVFIFFRCRKARRKANAAAARVREERAEVARLERERAERGSIELENVEEEALPKYQQHENTDDTSTPPEYVVATNAE